MQLRLKLLARLALVICVLAVMAATASASSARKASQQVLKPVPLSPQFRDKAAESAGAAGSPTGWLSPDFVDELEPRQEAPVPTPSPVEVVPAAPAAHPDADESCDTHDHLHYLGYYSYRCDGPDGDFCPTKWPHIELDNALVNQCGSNARQSPIDLPNYADVKQVSPVKLDVEYDPFHLSGAKLFNNGKTLEVLLPRDVDATLTLIDGELEIDYQLVQFHFHAPSEHTIDGKSLAFEMHLVHIRADEEHVEGERFLFLTVLFTCGPENEMIAKLFDRMPSPPPAHKQESIAKITDDVTIDLDAFLSSISLSQFYNYKGSLTTPPCTEQVDWFVLKNPLTVSREQLEKFTSALPEGRNARPVQHRGSAQEILRGQL